MHLGNELDVHQCGAVHPYKKGGIELYFQMAERLPVRIAAPARIYSDAFCGRLDEFYFSHRKHDDLSPLGEQESRARRAGWDRRRPRLIASRNEKLCALQGARKSRIIERLEQVVDRADSESVERPVGVGSDENDVRR